MCVFGMCDAWFVADSSRPRRSVERTQDMHNGSIARGGATNGVNTTRCPWSSTPIKKPRRAFRKARLVLVSRGRTLTETSAHEVTGSMSWEVVVKQKRGEEWQRD